MHFLRLLALTASATLANAYSYAVFDTLPEIPSGWQELPTRINAAATLSMRLHLHEQSWPELQSRLEDVSEPDHPDYGNHLSGSDIQHLLSPSSTALDSVKTWLAANDIEITEIDFDYVKFTATVAQAQDLLKAEYRYYKNVETGKTVLRTMEYSLPSALHDAVALVQPTTMFGLRALRSTLRPLPASPMDDVPEAGNLRIADPTAEVPLACNSTITVACLAALYGFADYNSTGRGSIGISGFLEQYAQHDDLTSFLARYKPSIAATGNFSFVGIRNGAEVGINDQNPKDINSIGEANLDIQYTVGISYPTPNTYFSTPGRPPFIPDLDVTENDSEPYLAYLEALLKLPARKLPAVITTSYGEAEQTVPLGYRRKVCNLFGALGARGTSVIFASGDSGAGWSCRSNTGSNATIFQPVFPAACPWVTSVGGTTGTTPSERAAYFSAGGFSSTWPAPSYQRRALATYFAKHKPAWQPWSQYFNKAGRGFPDVAAQAENYRVVLNGSVYLLAGTSASAPAFAAIVALLNDARLARGRRKLGFLNPALYRNPDMFTDVVEGRSTGCDGKRWGTPIPAVNGTGPAVVEGAGWDAVQGWDPVTGLGTPVFGKLRGL
ncbi:putative tripeptidyl-peptidase [Geopyxis carbonaria]|nr:putative tripeptidyl-peptidase [Geopyxis carbonaria]